MLQSPGIAIPSNFTHPGLVLIRPSEVGTVMSKNNIGGTEAHGVRIARGFALGVAYRNLHPNGRHGWYHSGAIHIIQQVQSAVGVGVTVQAMHTHVPNCLSRYAHPSILPS